METKSNLSLSNKLRLFAESYASEFPPAVQAIVLDKNEKVIVAEMLLLAADQLENPKAGTDKPAKAAKGPAPVQDEDAS